MELVELKTSKLQKAYAIIEMPKGCRDCRLINGDKSLGFFEARNFYYCPIIEDGWYGNSVPSIRPPACSLKPVKDGKHDRH